MVWYPYIHTNMEGLFFLYSCSVNHGIPGFKENSNRPLEHTPDPQLPVYEISGSLWYFPGFCWNFLGRMLLRYQRSGCWIAFHLREPSGTSLWHLQLGVPLLYLDEHEMNMTVMYLMRVFVCLEHSRIEVDARWPPSKFLWRQTYPRPPVIPPEDLVLKICFRGPNCLLSLGVCR